MLATSFLLAPGWLSPASADAIGDCNDATLPAARIAGCSTIIQGDFPPDIRAIAFMNRAIGFAASGRFDDALTDLDAALEADPNLLSARYNRGNVHLDLGRPGAAISDFSEVIRRLPSLAVAWLNRGLAHEAAGNEDEAVADLEQALRLEPTLEAAKRALARVRARR